MATTIATETITLFNVLVSPETGKVFVCKDEYTETETEFVNVQNPAFRHAKLITGEPNGFCYRTKAAAVQAQVARQQREIAMMQKKLDAMSVGLQNLLLVSEGGKAENE